MKNPPFKPLISGRQRENRLLHDFRELPPIYPPNQTAQSQIEDYQLARNLWSKSTLELTDDSQLNIIESSELDDIDFAVFYEAFL